MNFESANFRATNLIAIKLEPGFILSEKVGEHIVKRGL